MELKRGLNDEDASGSSGESLSSRKRLRPSSTSKTSLSGRTVKLLAENVCFPNVSKGRLKHIKASILESVFCFRDANERPDPRAVAKEHKIGSYFDTQCPIYSDTFADVPKVEVGKQLDVLDLLGDNLLRFSTSSKNIHSIRPTSYEALCGPNKGFKTNKSGSGDGSCSVERIQTPLLRRCANVVGGGGAMGSPTSTTSTGKTEIVNMESTLNLKGKYVMICCVFVPSIWCSEDGLWVYHTALASHELARRDDFELVIVPMMREGFTHSLSAYHHFLSGFSCLAVPFQDSHRREFICSSLGFDGKLDCFVLDPSQKVLYHGLPRIFAFCGGAEEYCFPFTPEVYGIFLRCFEPNPESRSLDELLDLSDTDVLYNVEYLAGGRLKEDGRSITISELKQKVVGIYMLSDGTSLRRLKEVHEEYIRRKRELEIVVVCYPFRDQVPPKLYDDMMIDILASLKVLCWWFFPFNHTVCHRLERMRVVDREEESLFIVDPSVRKRVDPYGLRIIRDFGMDSYPFTRRKLIDKEFERKLRLRFGLIFPWKTVRAALDPKSSTEIPVAMLAGKIVVLYLYKDSERSLAPKLDAWYKNYIKGRHPKVVVVAACIDVDRRGITVDEEFMNMGWLVCPADPTNSAKLCKEYWHPGLTPCEALAVFNDDGQITSVDPDHIFRCHCPPLDRRNLREEICRVDFVGALYSYMLH